MDPRDPIFLLAKQRIVKASADLEVQISSRQGGAVAIEVLRRLRERAAESLAALAFINFQDPAETAKALTLQTEVKRYDEWVGWLRELISEGKAYDEEMSRDERDELLDLLIEQGASGEQQAIALGLIDPRDQ